LGLQNDRALIEDSFVKPSQKARFLASVAPYSGDWLLALLIANCGLRFDDEAVRVAVGMRLGLALCVPHSCPCGDQVDAQDLHAMAYKEAPGRIARHHLAVFGFCRHFSPQKAIRIGQARWQTASQAHLIIPWQGGKSLAWDITVVRTPAQSYVDRAATGVGMVAELAAERKLMKCKVK